jgi:hypothetical protein
MRHPFRLALAIGSAAALLAPRPCAEAAAQEQPAPYGQPTDCREFTAPVTINGRQELASGQACRQPDGSWRITQSTPGLPPQVYALPPEAIYAAPYPYPYYWTNPWAFAPPFFVGGSILFADGFHRFHHRGFHRDGRHHDHFGGFHGGHR